MHTTLNAAITTGSRSRPSRWLWAGLFALATALALWGAWTLGLGLWAEATGLHGDFDVTVNGQPWAGDVLGGMPGWAIAAAAAAGLGLVLVALAVLLPMALAAVLLGGLLLVGVVVGLVVGVVALPMLLVLTLLLSPLLALAGLAWMLFA